MECKQKKINDSNVRLTINTPLECMYVDLIYYTVSQKRLNYWIMLVRANLCM